MNAEQLYTAYKRLADTSRKPYMTREKFKGYYEEERLVWLKEKNSDLETEYVRRALAPFRKVHHGKGDFITLPADLFLIRKVEADFPGMTNQPVTPIEEDAFSEARHDPFRKGTNGYPKYVEQTGDSIGIQAKSMPLAVRITYLIQPEPLDFTNQADVKESDLSAKEILVRVVGQGDLSTENVQRYQLSVGRETPAKEQNPAGQVR